MGTTTTQQLFSTLCLTAGLCLFANATAAQNVTGTDLILSGEITQNGTSNNYFRAANSSFDGTICVGFACQNIESNGTGNAPLKLKWTEAALIFEDTSSSSFADRDWRIGAVGSFPATEKFVIMDEGSNWLDGAEVTPFTIMGGAPENAFFIGSGGQIGLGTSIPGANLHVSGGSATVRLEQTAFTPIAWDMYIDPTGHFYVYNNLVLSTAFTIAPTAPDNALFIGQNGVGMGTFDPQTKLHIAGTDGSAQLLVQETSTTTTPRALLNLQNNGRPEIVMGNSSTNGEWSFGAGTNFVLKSGAVGSDSSAKVKAVTFKPNGDLDIEGVLTTAGGTCGGGCDLVFSDGYDLPSIKEHADKMWKLGYLPNVGPTKEGAPINVSDKLGRMLNELEHAHIYISQQEQTIQNLKQSVTTLGTDKAALEARIARLETLVTQGLPQPRAQD